MTDLSPLFPRQHVPSLQVPLVGGGSFDLSAGQPEQFTLPVFYRGLHCPLCKVQLRDLEGKLAEFEKRAVSVVAISTDPQDRAERTKAEWIIPSLRVGYDLDLTTARSWGLYVSAGIGKTSAGVEEPALFAEPALSTYRTGPRVAAHEPMSGGDTGCTSPRYERLGLEVPVRSSGDEVTGNCESVAGCSMQRQEPLG